MDEKEELEMLRRFVAEHGHPLEFAEFRRKWNEVHIPPGEVVGPVLTETPTLTASEMPVVDESTLPVPKRPKLKIEAKPSV